MGQISGNRSQLVADIAAGDGALLEADTWLADAIGSCLNRSAAAVELFFRRPESNDLYAEAQGVTTLLRIAALARHEPGAGMTQAEQAFDDSKPLFMGMGNDEALLAVTQIASEFGMLSDRCRNTLDVYRAIADKLTSQDGINAPSNSNSAATDAAAARAENCTAAARAARHAGGDSLARRRGIFGVVRRAVLGPPRQTGTAKRRRLLFRIGARRVHTA